MDIDPFQAFLERVAQPIDAGGRKAAARVSLGGAIAASHTKGDRYGVAGTRFAYPEAPPDCGERKLVDFAQPDRLVERGTL